jgi:threonine synthase
MQNIWQNIPKCVTCQSEFMEPYLWCPNCNKLLSIPPVKGPKASSIILESMWSLKDFLPKFENPVSMKEGATPILKIFNIDKLKGLNLKLEFRNPTGSFRDRASSLLVSDAIRTGKKQIVGVSTGSLGISLAAYASKANLKSINILPQNTELSKIEQLKIYGSEVIESGEFTKDTIEMSKKLANDKKAYHISPENNILIIESQKTIGLEIALQMKNIESIVVPRGSGTLILSIFRGLEDANFSGWISTFPKIYSVVLKKSQDSHLAESLEIADPLLVEVVDDIIKNSGGIELEIDANLMVDDALELAKNEGLFIEPASGSVLSACKILIAEKKIDPNSTIAILSGSGLNALNTFATQLRDMKKVVWGLGSTSTKKFEILNLIAKKGSTYGYAIWVNFGKIQSLQSIYQHLIDLEGKKMIKAEINNKKKIYSLTPKGEETLEKMRNLIDFL